MKKYKVKIAGIAPFLMARHPTPDEEKVILSRSQSGRKKMKDLSDKEQFEMHAYKTNKGKFYLASGMIKAAMRDAAVNFKLEGKKTYKDLMRSGILVDPLQIIFKQQKFTSDGQWGRNKNTGGAIWVVRPRIDTWETEFVINLLQDERITEEVLREVLEYAGFYKGVGAYRPDFGRFKIIEFKEIIK